MSTNPEHGGQAIPATDGGAAGMDLASVRPRVVHDLQLHEVTICSCPPGTPGHYPIISATVDGERVALVGEFASDASERAVDQAILSQDSTFSATFYRDPEEPDEHDRSAGTTD